MNGHPLFAADKAHFFRSGRFDIDPDRRQAERSGATVLGGIPYDESVTLAQMRKMTVIEYGDTAAARAIRRLWQDFRTALDAIAV